MDVPDNPELLESFKVGADRVAFFGELVIIDAAREMPGWIVREFARKPIYFRSKKYLLRSKSPSEKPYALRYVLEPWPADFAEPQREFLTYDEETVAHRDAAIRRAQASGAVRHVLLLLYPFLGFLWSSPKDKLARLGFEPRSITSASVLLTFALLLPELVFAGIVLWVSTLKGQPAFAGFLRLLWGSPDIRISGLTLPFWPVEFLVVAAVTADFLMRFSKMITHTDEAPYGFLEWLKRR